MNFCDYLLEESASLQRIAVIAPEGQITYSELTDSIAKQSEWLKSSIGKEKKVLLIADNSLFFVISYLAILKSGNVCVPLNPATSESSIGFIAGQCESELAFIHSKYAAKFADLVPNLIDEVKQQSIIADAASVEYKRKKAFPSDQLATIIYTSDSTALPKGVMLSHRNLRANTASIVSYLSLTQDDRMLAVLPFYYCYGLSLLHTHLRVGGSLVLNNSFMMLNTVLDDLLNHRCTGFAGVPSHFQILVRKYRRFPDLRYVTQAGGKLPDAFIREFINYHPDIEFFVMYGQTEATARLSYLPPDMLRAKPDSIGKGIPGVKLEVVDKQGNPIDEGIGELVASGDNIMMGYYQDEELTAETIRNGKLYTGDIGQMDSDGYIYIVAREKEFLKVGGERVSPKEIEAVISTLPEVVDCSIVGVEDDISGEAIKALIVLRDEAEISKNDVIKHCTRHLSAAKVPKFVEFPKEIPLAATGKKLRRKTVMA